MKIDLNDPRITAFALGELKGQDAIEIARAVRNDSRVRAAVDEVRDTSGMLMDVLGGGEAHLLTPEQRDTVRKAGSSPVITDISSARVPFWKRPAVAGVGVAAAVAMMIYYIGGRPGAGPAGGSPDTLENPATWDWAAVDLESLTLPADPAGVLDSEPSRSSDALHAVSAAISDNTTRFRRELSERIEQLEPGEISSAKSLPELDRDASQPWRSVEKGKPIPVPLASGATSWPWIKRSIMEQKKLPPPRAVRIEEM
ncbi:MAG: hypothetical protein KJO79_04020, partial [Verrucomicrobiae bacterium]|nr:hypothetical protein [Verrucomicrobiae bacterium]NNJ86326.1 hypothetical protein [Akkermansiaceae bacterium]